MIQFLTVFIIAVLVVIDQLIKLAVIKILRTDWQLNGHSESDSAFIS